MSRLLVSPQDRASLAGMDSINKARRENLVRMFGGTEMVFEKSAIKNAREQIFQDARKVRQETGKLIRAENGSKSGKASASAAGGIGRHMPSASGDQVHHFVSMASGLDYKDAVAAVTAEVMHSAIGEMIPFVGLAVSSAKAAMSWTGVVKGIHDVYRGNYYLKGVLEGDPSAAVAAAMQCIRRLLAAQTTDAVRNTASLVGHIHTLGAAAPVIGLANAGVKLIADLAILGRDYKDMQAGNKHLRSPETLSANVFRDCPILGCYLLTCSDTSTVLNFSVAEMAQPGFVARVDDMRKKQLGPLLEKATTAIVKSHISLVGLPSNKGRFVAPGLTEKAKQKFHLDRLISGTSVRFYDRGA